MLTIIKRKRKIRDYLTYDLEWIPGDLKLRLFGVYDKARGYRCYQSVRAFLYNELTSKNRGKWFFAHAGGLADFQFVLEELAKREQFQVRACFSGSSAIIVHVSRGKNAWHFVDSYWLLRDKLEEIAKWIGTEKGAQEQRRTKEQAKEFYAGAPLYDLMKYNEQDCKILWDAIDLMQDVLYDLGGQLQMTLASSAMFLFRRRFLSGDIETNWSVNNSAEKAYFASRVEVLNSDCYNADYFDINSSFPYAMTKPCPGELIDITRSLPDHGIYMADVTIDIPECYLPPIPMRLCGRLFFATGSWRCWLTSIDIELLQREGGRIMRVWQVKHFAPFHDLTEYALTLYNMRKKASTPFERTAFKLLLNSLYGKFAERREKTSIHVNPEKIDRDNWEMLFPGAWLYDRIVPVPHRHVPISAHITARARQTIYEYMSDCREVHYCDTDGFSTTSKLVTGNELGDLKLEKRIRHGHFVQPKVYRLEGQDRNSNGGWSELGDRGVKAKGFSGMDVPRFERLLEGQAIEYERMRRIKELARRGDFRPREDVIFKRLKQEALPKRFMYPDGHTRPWQIKELETHFRKGTRQ